VRFYVALALLTLVGLGGCSASKPKTVPVSGKVMYKKDTPAEGALVVFHPTPEMEARISGKPFARVGADGTFVLTTYEENDGAPEGEYGVTIDYRVKDKGGEPKFRLGGDEGGAGGKLAIDVKYTNPQQPVLKATVKRGEKNEFLFEVE